jgi:hypothetical protein
MPVCPFCQAELAMPNLPCQGCGKRMSDHPSLREGKSYSVRPSVRTSGSMGAVRAPAGSGGKPIPFGVMVPDLELAIRPAQPKRLTSSPRLTPPREEAAGGAARPSTPSPQPGAGVGPATDPGVGGAVFDEDDIFAPSSGLSAPLELDRVPSPTPGKGAQAPLAPLSLRPLGASSSRALGLSMASTASGFADTDEAIALADYGEKPTSLWQAPLYAYRVKTRQMELRQQLAERRSDLARARQAEEEAKIAFAERARPVAERAGAFRFALDAIVSAEGLMLQRDGALSVETASHRSRLSVIDERVAGLERELVTAKAEEREVEVNLAEAEAIRQRAEVKLKRAEIEVRNAAARVEGGGVQGGSPKRAGPAR